VLANPDRLLLLCQLTQGEHCVSDLESALDIHQPTLSQQLGVLRDEQLVNTRREGKQIFYSIASEEAQAVMQVLYDVYCGKKKGKAVPALCVNSSSVDRSSVVPAKAGTPVRGAVGKK
jgi:ArsR family transcriptional regulator